MRKYICLLLFSLFSMMMFGQHTYDHRLVDAIDIGVYESPFTFTDIPRYTGDYTDDFERPATVPIYMETNDIFYRLTLTHSMDVKMVPTWSDRQLLLVYLLDASGNCLRGSVSGVTFSLQPGTYYFVIEPEPSYTPDYVVPEGTIHVQITGGARAIGEDFFYPFELGTFNSEFHIAPTVTPMDNYRLDFYRTSDMDYNDRCHDAVFRFTLEKAMLLSMDNEGTLYVPLKNYYESKLLNAYGDTLATRRNGFSDTSTFKVPAGTYYLYVWAEIRSFSSSNEMVVRLNGMVDDSGGIPDEPGKPEIVHGHPHLITRTPRVETDNMSSLGNDELLEEIHYFDHWGQLEETVQRGITPEGNDLVTLYEYDGFGNLRKQWLPVPVSGTNGACLHPVYLHRVAIASPLYNQDPYPYNETVYDGSPLNRVTLQFGAGKDWQNMFRPIRTDYLTNIDYGMEEYKVRLYHCTDTTLYCMGNYPNSALYGTRTTDEDGNISYEYKNKAGYVVLTRQMDGKQLHDTYYVYDEYGNVRFVLPPLVADSLSSVFSWKEDNETLMKYAYIYHYDNYNRCIYKKLPGCAPVYIIYDGADRPVFTQDGKQRERGEWSFSLPDPFGRIVLSGTCKNTFDYASNPLGSQIIKAVRTNTTNVLKGYDVSGITLTMPVVLSANYYDTYSFLGLNGIPADVTTAYTEVSGYGKRYSGGCIGQQTGSLAARLSATGAVSGYLYSVMYYDERYRVIQRKSNNRLGGSEEVYIAYNFSGQPTQEKLVHTVPGKEILTEIRQHTYDHAGRLLKTTSRLGNGTTVTLADNIYDEAGRLKSDRRNGDSNLKTDYAYNARSWTKSISGPLLTSLCIIRKRWRAIPLVITATSAA